MSLTTYEISYMMALTNIPTTAIRLKDFKRSVADALL